MELRLDGKVALVTGGGKGLGRACALAFARAGADVAICDVDETAAAAVKAEIEAANQRCFTGSCNVSSAAEVKEFFHGAVEALGSLDITLNNAGVSAPIVPLAETEEADFDRLMSVNLKGVWLCLREALRIMEPQGQGNIINMDSALGRRTFPGVGLYVSSKFAVAGLTRNTAIEYAEKGIRINAMCPGNVATPLLVSSTTEEMQGILADQHPMKRLGTEEEIANLALFLASDASSFMTGELVAADGGWTAL
ncbi:bacilysin biosynthesis oxidoreductase BacC [Luminiphilus syltensis NOR5-1B]|uniref:Bacilysin biosynthesis oxidoreductase BacC n=1 Tax=Luminiphilus syltensis NOR5-1B TaxID=565045 RepID=B8KSN5_9GAMM|nr:glucose 1-dehydrogenase [Luminiphilus syltensis]EED35790.1 bacilysin biosynthesis oxidoreductase BacC [Luminiphilus syltensis NOR5-1B]